MIVETLADMVIDASKQEVRDVYSLAIRSTISELHDNAATNMIRAVYPKLAKGLKVGKDEVKEECLEILAEIFRKFHVILNKVNNLIPKDEPVRVYNGATLYGRDYHTLKSPKWLNDQVITAYLYLIQERSEH